MSTASSNYPRKQPNPAARSFVCRRAKCTAILVFGALTLAPAIAFSDDPSASDQASAQKAYQSGLRAERDNSLDEARSFFQNAIDLVDNPIARQHLAQLEERTGHLIEALDHYQALVNNNRSPWALRQTAKKEIDALQRRIAHLTLKPPPDFHGVVKIDTMELTSESLGQRIQVNPGSRKVVAKAEGYHPFEMTFVLPEGGSRTVDLALAPVEKEKAPALPPPVPPSNARTTVGYLSLGIGATGLVVGSIFGLAARSTREELRSSCLNNICDDRQRDNYDRGQLQAGISTGAFLVGGIGVALGTILLVNRPKDTKPPANAQIRPLIGPASLGVQGAF